MNDSDIYAIIKSLVGHKEDALSRSPRALIKQLLPIDVAYGYYLSNKVSLVCKCYTLPSRVRASLKAIFR